MLALLQKADLPLWVQLLDVGATLVILIGGTVFACYKFFAERTHAKRVQVGVDYEMAQVGGEMRVSFSISAENIGLTRVKVAPEYCGMRIYTRRNRNDQWWLQQADPVFQDEQWIEPTETIEDSVWFELYRSDWVAIKADLYVASKHNKGWVVNKVINLAVVDQAEGG